MSPFKEYRPIGKLRFSTNQTLPFKENRPTGELRAPLSPLHVLLLKRRTHRVVVDCEHTVPCRGYDCCSNTGRTLWSHAGTAAATLEYHAQPMPLTPHRGTCNTAKRNTMPARRSQKTAFTLPVCNRTQTRRHKRA